MMINNNETRRKIFNELSSVSLESFLVILEENNKKRLPHHKQYYTEIKRVSWDALEDHFDEEAQK